MKRIIIVLFAFAVLQSSAQSSSDSTGSLTGKYQLMVGAWSNGPIVLIKKYTSQSFAWRYGFNVNYSANSNFYAGVNYTYFPPNGNSSYYTNKNSEFNFFINFGLQKSFAVYKRFEPFVGIDIGLGNKLIKSSYENTSDGNSIYKNSYSEESKSNFNPEGYLTPFLGFNYYATRRFAIGAEFRLDLVYITHYSKKDYKFTSTDNNGEQVEYRTTDQNSRTSYSGSLGNYLRFTATYILAK